MKVGMQDLLDIVTNGEYVTCQHKIHIVMKFMYGEFYEI
jgi:hypothetical protein